MSCVVFTEYPIRDKQKIVGIRLNVENSLNALSLEMIDLITLKLDEIRNDNSVVAVLLEGAGDKAFCAGGDIVKLYQAVTQKGHEAFVERWFISEYAMDYTLHCFPKPVICWGGGIVMGGGLGMMNGCSHRIVTETTRMAMPEITIALYPDVGASWFFNRMPRGVGNFLALTGVPIAADDALYLDLADHFLLQEQRAEVIEKLQLADWRDEAHQVVSSVILSMQRDVVTAPGLKNHIKNHYETIKQLGNETSVSAFSDALNALDTASPWLQRARDTFNQGSPLAAHIIFEQLRRNRHSSLPEAFQSELVLTRRCCEQPELAEGIRALLVDKDKQPDWIYKSVGEVDVQYVEGFFQPYSTVNPLVEILDQVERDYGV